MFSTCSVVALTIVMLLVSGCDEAELPPITATGLTIVAPLPGTATSVAYVTLHNNSEADAVLTAVNSPDFGKVEMHETVITDGIARMSRLDSVAIAAASSVVFAPGGKHIMLIDPHGVHAPGDLVSLKVHYDEAGLLLLQAPLQNRAGILPPH